jgi:hypothetical protein
MTGRRRIAAAWVARALWGGLALLPACASSQEWIYSKPKNTPAELEHDKLACRKIAPSRSLLRVLEEEKVEREAFNRCMRARGYTVTVAPR